MAGLTRALEPLRSPHSPFALFITVILWLSFGAAWSGYWVAVAGLALFAAVILIGYLTLLRWSFAETAISSVVARVSSKRPVFWLWAISVAAAAITLVHYVFFNGFTLLLAMQSSSNVGAALIRQEIFDSSPSWLTYASSFATRAVFPVVPVLALYHKRPWLAVFTLAVGCLYAANLMMKINPIIVLAPTAVFLLMTRRYWWAVGLGALSCILVFAMTLAANPEARPSFLRGMELKYNIRDHQPAPPAEEAPTAEAPPLEPIPPAVAPQAALDPAPQVVQPPSPEATLVLALMTSLAHRIFIVPGLVVGQWFDNFPDEIAYGYGCGYRFLTPLLDCEFQNYPRILHDILYPELVALGLVGNVNAASMMTAYANFGWAGLAGIAVFHSFVFWAIYALFRKDPILALPINFSFVLLLSSGDILTMLLSGGWGLALMLCVIARP